LSFIVKAFKTASLSQTTQSLIEDDKPISGDYYTMFTLTSLAVAQCKTYRKYQITAHQHRVSEKCEEYETDRK